MQNVWNYVNIKVVCLESLTISFERSITKTNCGTLATLNVCSYDGKSMELHLETYKTLIIEAFR